MFIMGNILYMALFFCFGTLFGYYLYQLYAKMTYVAQYLTPKKQEPSVVWPQKQHTSGVKTGGVIRPKTQAMLDAEREAQINRELGL